MNGNELLRKLKKTAKNRGVEIRQVKAHGKGSHTTLYFGDRRTTMKDPKKEIGKGLLKAMLEQLGLTEGDL